MVQGWRGDLRKLRRRAVAERKVIGFTLAAADTWETILQPSSGKRLAVTQVHAWQDATGSVDVRLRDSAGNGPILSEEISRDRGHPLINAAVALPIDGDLQAQVSDTAVTLSVWAIELEA